VPSLNYLAFNRVAGHTAGSVGRLKCKVCWQLLVSVHQVCLGRVHCNDLGRNHPAIHVNHAILRPLCPSVRLSGSLSVHVEVAINLLRVFHIFKIKTRRNLR